MKCRWHHLPILLVFHFTIPICQGQSDKRTDFQTWTDFTITYHQSEKLSLGGDFGTRGLFSHHNWSQLYIRPTVHYTFSPVFKISGGIGSFNTFNKTVSNSYEFRLFQDYQIAWPTFKGLSISHRFRFEQRFFFYQNIDNDFSIRGRYLIGLKTRTFKLLGKERRYYINGMWEGFVPLGESAPELFINNQRLYAAMGYRLSPTWHFEVYYIWQKSRFFIDEGFQTQEDILRLRVFHVLNSNN